MHTPDGWVRLNTGQVDLRDTFVQLPTGGAPGGVSGGISLPPGFCDGVGTASNSVWTDQYGTVSSTIPRHLFGQDAAAAASLNSAPISDAATVIQVSTYNQAAKSEAGRLGRDDPSSIAESFDSWWLRSPPKKNIFMGQGLWWWIKRISKKDDPNIVTRVQYLRCNVKSTMVTAPPHHVEFYYYAYFFTIYLLLFVTWLIVFNFTDLIYAKPPMRDPKGLLWSIDPYIKLFFLSFITASLFFSIIVMLFFICCVRPFKPEPEGPEGSEGPEGPQGSQSPQGSQK